MRSLRLLLGLAATVLAAAALAAPGARSGDAERPRPARPSAGEARHVVRAGDTLWEIAVARYDGDPREGVWRIEQRNALAGDPLQPGQVLVLPP